MAELGRDRITSTTVTRSARATPTASATRSTVVGAAWGGGVTGGSTAVDAGPGWWLDPVEGAPAPLVRGCRIIHQAAIAARSRTGERVATILCQKLRRGRSDPARRRTISAIGSPPSAAPIMIPTRA